VGRHANRREFTVGASMDTSQLLADDKWVATATFDEPGTYVLRARADDGALTTDEDLTVNVAR
jgi:hypothetical protein